jgi:hypothetical protein
MTAYVDNTNVLQIVGLRDTLTADFINDATVVVTVKDADGDAVAGETWPMTMAYVTGSNGDYSVTLSTDLDIEARVAYFAHIDATVDGNVASWQFRFRPQVRN